MMDGGLAGLRLASRPGLARCTALGRSGLDGDGWRNASSSSSSSGCDTERTNNKHHQAPAPAPAAAPSPHVSRHRSQPRSSDDG